MSEPAVPGFFVRFFLAFGVYFRFLFNKEFAGAVLRIGKGEITASTSKTPPIEARPQAVAPMLKEAPPDSALQLLGLLQQEGRNIDFIE